MLHLLPGMSFCMDFIILDTCKSHILIMLPPNGSGNFRENIYERENILFLNLIENIKNSDFEIMFLMFRK